MANSIDLQIMTQRQKKNTDWADKNQIEMDEREKKRLIAIYAKY